MTRAERLELVNDVRRVLSGSHRRRGNYTFLTAYQILPSLSSKMKQLLEIDTTRPTPTAIYKAVGTVVHVLVQTMYRRNKEIEIEYLFTGSFTIKHGKSDIPVRPDQRTSLGIYRLN